MERWMGKWKDGFDWLSNFSINYLVYIIDLRIGENIKLGINIIEKLDYLNWLRILANALKIHDPAEQYGD